MLQNSSFYFLLDFIHSRDSLFQCQEICKLAEYSFQRFSTAFVRILSCMGRNLSAETISKKKFKLNGTKVHVLGFFWPGSNCWQESPVVPHFHEKKNGQFRIFLKGGSQKFQNAKFAPFPLFHAFHQF